MSLTDRIVSEYWDARVIITGGAGFIGSQLAKNLSRMCPSAKILIFDKFGNASEVGGDSNFSLGTFRNLASFSGSVLCADLVKPQDIKDLIHYRPTHIFHLAAISDTRCYDEELIITTNVNSFYNILTVASQSNAKLIYASSAATYGSLPAPQKVGVEKPENPYGFSKLCMDNISVAETKINTLIGLRYFNVYGPGEEWKGRSASMIFQLYNQIRSESAVKLFEGSEHIKRDFVYIDDVVTATLLAGQGSKRGVVNVGTGTSESFLTVAMILSELLDKKIDIQWLKNPYDDYQMHTQADLSELVDLIGFTPAIDLRQGIMKYIPYIESLKP